MTLCPRKSENRDDRRFCSKCAAPLAIATTMYREMDIRFWLEHEEAESRALA